MCLSSTPKVPTPQPIPQTTPVEQDQAVSDAAARERKRIAAAAGRAATMVTGGRGVTSAASVAQKTLLGA